MKDARGITLLLDKDSLVDLHVYHHDRWEEDRVAYLTQLIGAMASDAQVNGAGNCYFFDVGSYFGQYSLVVKKEFPHIKVCAFEANPYNYIQLRSNILLNDMVEDVITYNRCVSDKGGRTSVGRPDRYNRGSASVGDAYLGSDQSIFAIDNLVFDEEFGSIEDSLIFMKMDIEGSEPAALRGMRSFLSKNRIVLQIEDWQFPDSDSAKILRDIGFSLIRDMNPDFFYTNFSIPAPDAAV